MSQTIQKCQTLGQFFESLYPALALACHSGISSNDLEDLFIGNNIYIDYLRARHPTLLGHLAREGQRE
jgi:hypothetical protein